MYKRLVILISLLIIEGLVFAPFINAKLLPRFSNGGKTSSRVTNSVLVGVKLRSDRRALEVNFGNLTKARSVMYTLIYSANGIDQGVNGSIDLSGGNSTSRELLFGTCSTGVCTYHSNILNMKLDITSELTSGKTVIRHFRIRV